MSLVTGSKLQVWRGTAQHTSGGLYASDLMQNARGKIVSKKQHAAGMKAAANLGIHTRGSGSGVYRQGSGRRNLQGAGLFSFMKKAVAKVASNPLVQMAAAQNPMAQMALGALAPPPPPAGSGRRRPAGMGRRAVRGRGFFSFVKKAVSKVASNPLVQMAAAQNPMAAMALNAIAPPPPPAGSGRRRQAGMGRRAVRGRGFFSFMKKAVSKVASNPLVQMAAAQNPMAQMALGALAPPPPPEGSGRRRRAAGRGGWPTIR